MEERNTNDNCEFELNLFIDLMKKIAKPKSIYIGEEVDLQFVFKRSTFWWGRLYNDGGYDLHIRRSSFYDYLQIATYGDQCMFFFYNSPNWRKRIGFAFSNCIMWINTKLWFTLHLTKGYQVHVGPETFFVTSF